MENESDNTASAQRKPMGVAIVWSDATLDALSAITEDDIARAKRWWKRNAPPRYARLLDAEPVEGEQDDGE